MTHRCNRHGWHSDVTGMDDTPVQQAWMTHRCSRHGRRLGIFHVPHWRSSRMPRISGVGDHQLQFVCTDYKVCSICLNFGKNLLPSYTMQHWRKLHSQICSTPNPKEETFTSKETSFISCDAWDPKVKIKHHWDTSHFTTYFLEFLQETGLEHSAQHWDEVLWPRRSWRRRRLGRRPAWYTGLFSPVGPKARRTPFSAVTNVFCQKKLDLNYTFGGNPTLGYQNKPANCEKFARG